MLKKNVMTEKTKEMTDHFKGCLTRATFLRAQGFLDSSQFKVVRNRILEQQGIILKAFGKCE